MGFKAVLFLRENFGLFKKPMGTIPVLLVLMGFALGAENHFEILEFKVKSEFILRFPEYVEWPKHSLKKNDSLFQVCTLGEGPLLPYLKSHLASRPVKGHAVTVREIKEKESLTGCHLLYIAPEKRKNLDQVIRNLDDTPVLTIGDTEGFGSRGVVINLFLEGQHVRFNINEAAAKKSGLKVSSKLLVLAKPGRGS
jgi:hypothetical protein